VPRREAKPPAHAKTGDVSAIEPGVRRRASPRKITVRERPDACAVAATAGREKRCCNRRRREDGASCRNGGQGSLLT
jgi:hypothetical protein